MDPAGEGGSEEKGEQGGVKKSVLQSASGLLLNTLNTTSMEFIKPQRHTHKIMSLCVRVRVCLLQRFGCRDFEIRLLFFHFDCQVTHMI